MDALCSNGRFFVSFYCLCSNCCQLLSNAKNEIADTYLKAASKNCIQFVFACSIRVVASLEQPGAVGIEKLSWRTQRKEKLVS